MPLLETRGLSGSRKPDSVDLTLYAGEVVGVAGLLGSGRSALARVLFGIDPKRAGEILIKGAPVEITGPRDAIAQRHGAGARGPAAAGAHPRAFGRVEHVTLDS